MVEFLLSIPEIDLNIKSSTGSVNSHIDDTSDVKPFYYAIVCGLDEIISLFFTRKNDIDINETFGTEISIFIIFNEFTYLHIAAKKDNAMLIKKLLKFQGIDKDKTTKIFLY